MEVNETDAVVSWREPKTPNGPIDGYEIALAPSQGEAPAWVDVESNSSTFAATNLTAGADYTFQITAYNLDENRRRHKSEIGILDFSTRELSTSSF